MDGFQVKKKIWLFGTLPAGIPAGIAEWSDGFSRVCCTWHANEGLLISLEFPIENVPKWADGHLAAEEKSEKIATPAPQRLNGRPMPSVTLSAAMLLRWLLNICPSCVCCTLFIRRIRRYRSSVRWRARAPAADFSSSQPIGWSISHKHLVICSLGWTCLIFIWNKSSVTWSIRLAAERMKDGAAGLISYSWAFCVWIGHRMWHLTLTTVSWVEGSGTTTTAAPTGDRFQWKVNLIRKII